MRVLHFLAPAMLGVVAVIPAMAADTAAKGTDLTALYTPCTFYPQGERCQEAHARALTDSSPMAQSVRQAFDQYARYLQPATSSLTDADQKFLAANDIVVPGDLNSADRSGLHNVINDPSLHSVPERVTAVNGFISRAMEAELYCGFNVCEARQTGAGS